ncbi:T9SS type B sorting domain-containing protein [Flavobacterium terrae]
MSSYLYRVRLDKIGNSCGLLSNEVSLDILPLPVVNSPISIVQCDDDLDGITTVNLTVNNSQISANSATQTFEYYYTQADAQNEITASKITNPTAYVNSSSPGAFTLWATVKNANGCFEVVQINVQIVTTQIPASYTKTFNLCDDYIDATINVTDGSDGFTKFDVSSVTDDLQTNVLPAGTYTIKYYRNVADRDSQLNEIVDPSNFRNDIPNVQVIWARVDSSVSNACFGYAKINLVVNPLPSIDLTAQEYICSDNPSIIKILTAGINDGSSTANYTYKWVKDTVEIIDQTGPTLQTNQEGIYTVEVKTSFGCPRTRTITVTKSNSAVFLETTVIDLQEENTVTINVTGDGNYVYSLDNELGPYQESNTFYDVSPDIHTVYVKDLYGCPTSEKTVNVVGAPKFFTPNGDGYHDHWNIIGLSKIYNSNAKIYIYNRFGKLLKQISATDQGWNGTFNGIPQPADDYWYTLELENGRTAKGHFALKR